MARLTRELDIRGPGAYTVSQRLIVNNQQRLFHNKQARSFICSGAFRGFFHRMI